MDTRASGIEDADRGQIAVRLAVGRPIKLFGVRTSRETYLSRLRRVGLILQVPVDCELLVP